MGWGSPILDFYRYKIFFYPISVELPFLLVMMMMMDDLVVESQIVRKVLLKRE